MKTFLFLALSAVSFAQTPQDFQPIEFQLPPQKVKLPNGNMAEMTSEIAVGPLTTSTIPKIKAMLSTSAEHSPVRTIFVVPQNADQNALAQLHQKAREISPLTDDSETVEFDSHKLREWLEKEYNTVYSVVRFALNSMTVGTTLVYSLGVPPAKAVLLGALSGTVAGLIQYNLDAYRDWIEDNQFAKDFHVPINSWDEDTKQSIKEVFNQFVNSAAIFGKFGFTEVSFHSASAIAMKLLKVPGLLPGFYGNMLNVLKTSLQASIAGVGALGLFQDVDIQKKYGGWSDQAAEFFQNTSTFILSAAGAAFSALQLANPAFSRTISLGLVDMPIGFAAITLVGLGFYAHALMTYMMSSGERVDCEVPSCATAF